MMIIFIRSYHTFSYTFMHTIAQQTLPALGKAAFDLISRLNARWLQTAANISSKTCSVAKLLGKLCMRLNCRNSSRDTERFACSIVSTNNDMGVHAVAREYSRQIAATLHYLPRNFTNNQSNDRPCIMPTTCI